MGGSLEAAQGSVTTQIAKCHVDCNTHAKIDTRVSARDTQNMSQEVLSLLPERGVS